MAGEIIVTVTAVTGEVLIQTESGPKQLQVGDQLVLGQQITTGQGASVELVTTDGQIIVVAPMTMFAVTEDLVAETAPGADESAVASESEQEILEALAAGEDLDQILEEGAPAAGGGGDGGTQEGHSFVILGRIDQEYRSFGVEFPSLSEEQVVEEQTTQFINQPPDAVDDSVITDEDTPVVISVLDNDSDPDNDPLTIVEIASQPSNGSVQINDDGTITYTPNENYNGSDSFQYTITDPSGEQDTATVNITIEAANDLPVIQGVSNTVVSEEGLAGGIADNVGSDDTTNSATDNSGTVTAFDVDGDTLSYTFSNPPAGLTSNGTPIVWAGAGTGTLTGSAGGEPVLVLTIDGSGNWTADLQGPIDHAGAGVETAGEIDADLQFTVTVNDGNGGTDSATITVTVEDDSPDANDDNYQVAEDDVLVINVPGVLGNDAAGADGGLTIVGNTDVSNGTLVFNNNGSFTYTPDPDYFGPDSFTYTVRDADGDESTATVNITVNSVNDAPLAIDDFNQLGEDTNTVGGNVLTGAGDPNSTPDSDPEGDDLDVTGFVTGNQDDGDLESPDTDGTIVGTYGTLTWNAETGAYTYDLDNANPLVQGLQLGESLEDVFTYEMNDGNGGFDTAVLTITINGSNDAPVISASTDVVVSEEGLEGGNPDALPDDLDPTMPLPVDSPDDNTNSTTNTSGTVTATDADGDTLSYYLSNPPGGLTSGGTPITWTGNGDPLDDPDGLVGATQLTGSAGGDTIIVVSIDGDGNWSADLQGPIDHPFTGDGDGVVYDESTASEDDEDELALDFTVTVDDGNGGTDDTTITVYVEDDSPIANNDSYTVDEDTLLDSTAELQTSVLDDDDVGADGGAAPNTIVGYTDVSHGTLNFDVTDGTFTYLPDADYHGPDSFTYTIRDADGDESTATVNITVVEVTDPPVLQSADDAVVSEEGLSDPYTPNPDTLPDDEAPADSPLNDNTNSASFSGQFVFTDSDGVDGDGGAYALADVALSEGTGAGSLLTADGETINWDFDSGVLIGTRDDDNEEVIRITLDGITQTDTNEWTVDYTVLLSQPVQHPFNGDGDGVVYDESTAEEQDEDEISFSVNVHVLTTDFNDAFDVTLEDDSPIAADDGYSTDEDTPLVVNAAAGVLDNDSVGGDGGLTIVGNTNPSNGNLTLNADGSFSYTPNANYNGSDSFTYTIRDADGDQSTATVNITVNSVNDPPVITATTNTVISEEGLSGANPDNTGTDDTTDSATDITGTVTATDAEGDTLTYTLSNPPAGLTSNGVAITWTGAGTGTLTGSAGGTTILVVSIASDGTWSADLQGQIDHTLNDNAEVDDVVGGNADGDLEFTVTVDDGNGGTDDAIIKVTVEDDSPEFGAPTPGYLYGAVGNSLTGSLGLSIGADSNGASLLLSALTIEVEGEDVVAVTYETEGGTETVALTSGGSYLTYENDVDGNLIAKDDTDTTVFTITGDVASGDYTIEIFQALDPIPLELPTTPLTSPGGGISGLLVVLDVAEGVQLRATAEKNGSVAEQVNYSPNGMGVSNAFVDDTNDEELIINFTQLDGSTPVVFLEATFTINHLTTGETLRWTAYKDGVMVGSSTTVPGTAGNNSTETNVLIDVEGGFDEVIFESDSGSYRVIGFSGVYLDAQTDFAIPVSATATDADGDSASLAAPVDIHISLDTTIGDADSNTDDVVRGGTGDDSLTGGLGADTFVWELGDQGTEGSPAVDTITDFSVAQGDVLDLQDLLQGETAPNLTEYLNFELVSGDTVIHVSKDGNFAGGVYSAGNEDQTIVLEGVDLTAGNTLTQQQIIDSLLPNHLSTD